MDDVFKALADPTRRSLLDELFKNDGQTLTQLEESLPMTRFGVMKHLKLLEEAHLVVTRRRGREKLHFLNVVPIRLLHDRWINKYTEPWASSLTNLKQTLENRTMEKIYEIYIKTTPERLWHAITDPVARAKYNFGVLVTSDWTKGSHFEGKGGGRTILEGEDVKQEGTSRVNWEIVPVADSCLLKVTHDQLREGGNMQVYGGWPMILSGLKTLLETGELLTTPGSLMYAQPPQAQQPAIAG